MYSFIPFHQCWRRATSKMSPCCFVSSRTRRWRAPTLNTNPWSTTWKSLRTSSPSLSWWTQTSLLTIPFHSVPYNLETCPNFLKVRHTPAWRRLYFNKLSFERSEHITLDPLSVLCCWCSRSVRTSWSAAFGDLADENGAFFPPPSDKTQWRRLRFCTGREKQRPHH